MIKKPKIGIIVDWQESGSYSSSQHFVLKTQYISAINLAGGISWLIPYSAISDVEQYLNEIDGLIVPGGFYKSPDEWYLNHNSTSPYQKSPRLIFEEAMIKKALEIDKPLLGICAGMQVMGAILGCKLVGNVHDYLGGKINHFGYQENHRVIVNSGSLLHKITNLQEFMVNSNHNEAIAKISDKVSICAQSDDGCIEAISVNNKKFALGLQWHPEALCQNQQQIAQSNPNFAIFRNFIKACS